MLLKAVFVRTRISNLQFLRFFAAETKNSSSEGTLFVLYTKLQEPETKPEGPPSLAGRIAISDRDNYCTFDFKWTLVFWGA